MQEQEKQVCINVMGKLMSKPLARSFVDIQYFTSQFPQLNPNFEFFPSILERVKNDQFTSIAQFSSYFEKNLNLVINSIAMSEHVDHNLIALDGVARSFISYFGKTLKKQMMSDFERYKAKIIKCNNKVEEIKQIRPRDYYEDEAIFLQVSSFNPDPIPQKVFPT